MELYGSICIEAKADESFGDNTVGGYLEGCLHRREQGISTRAPERIEALMQMVDEGWRMGLPSPWLEVRYQLLTALCGTVLQAQIDESDVAVLAVHVFETAETTRQRLDANASAFTHLVSVLTGGSIESIETTRLNGPISMKGTELFVGKAIV